MSQYLWVRLRTLQICINVHGGVISATTSTVTAEIKERLLHIACVSIVETLTRNVSIIILYWDLMVAKETVFPIRSDAHVP
jgi:hypothetical protein